MLFLCAWLPRAVALDKFVTPDEPKWLTRSANFYKALADGDIANTLQREHPGVTVMWAGALGILQMLPDYHQRTPGYFESGDTGFADWLHANTDITPLDLLAAGRRWIVLLISLLTALNYLPLRRLIGAVPAVVAVLFVAWMPFNIALARELHPDGLLASLSFLACTYFLVWLYDKRSLLDVVISGVLMGLAWLTKTPAVFLLLAGAILVAVELWRWRRNGDSPAPGRHSTPSRKTLIGGYCLWGLAAFLTFVVLWPVMWINPLGTLAQIAAEMTKYVAGHDNGNFFMGRPVEDPGVLFYPVAYYFRSSPATLIGLLAASVAAARRGQLFRVPNVRRTAFGMVVTAAVFFVGMTMAAKKFDRYLLPAFPPLDVVAALGWVAIAGMVADWLSSRRHPAAVATRYSRAAFALVVAFALLPLHGGLALLNFPYYLTYYNPLAGGSRVAAKVMFVGWGEGLDQAAAWLNQQPDAVQKRALSWYVNGPFSYFYNGVPLNVSGTALTLSDTDYVVLYANQIQRQEQPHSIRYLLAQPPAHIVNSAGLELARIYDIGAILDAHTDRARQLAAFPVSAAWPGLTIDRLRTWDSVAVGDVLLADLDLSGRTDGSLKLSARLVDAAGSKVVQQDLPVSANMEFALFISPETVPGDYTLQFVAYDRETQAPLTDLNGQNTTDVASVHITESP